jgi:hypothetical protein
MRRGSFGKSGRDAISEFIFIGESIAGSDIREHSTGGNGCGGGGGPRVLNLTLIRLGARLRLLDQLSRCFD